MPKEFRSEREWRALLAEQMARHGRFYYRIAYGVLRHAAAAEDVCQQAVVKALQRPGDLRAAESLRSWLAQIVVRESLQVRRRRKTEQRVLADHTNPTMEASSSDADWERREAVLDALEKLSEPTRSIVTWRLLDGMTGNEVKELLNCSAAHVSRQMHQGMEFLRGVLRDWEPGNNNKRGD